MENGLNITVHENVFDSPEGILERLEREIIYLSEEQSRVRIKDKFYPIPRQIAAFGDPGLIYTFSGLTLNSDPWTPFLLELKNTIEGLLGMEFNFVLINRYANGDSCLGQHKDNEADLEENYSICSVSFGETRTMVFKRPKFADQKIELKSNSLLVMDPPTNQLWSHGIPRQKQRTGLRINLTFRKLKNTNQVIKRKHTDSMDTESNNKKIRKDEPKTNGVFVEDDLPEHVFSLGDSLFLTFSNFRDEIVIHTRKYRQYGRKYYPTKKGITVKWWWIELLFRRQHLPESKNDLHYFDTIIPGDMFSIHSSDFKSFTFTRHKTDKDEVPFSCSIIMTYSQWRKAADQYEKILKVMVGFVYENMDFYTAFCSVDDLKDCSLKDCIPSSLDVNLGREYLFQCLRDSLSACLKDKSDMKDPYTKAHELIGNEEQTFYSAALTLDVTEIAETFSGKMWDRQPYLMFAPIDYVTVTFLRDVNLHIILKEVKNVLCPPDASEYFQKLNFRDSV